MKARVQRIPKWWFWAAALLVSLGILAAPLPVFSAAPVERVIRVDASRFQYSPAVLRVNPGDQVTIELASQDVVHGLSIDGYNLSVTADPGQTARLTFTADKTGSFRFHCTVTCGNLHPFMIGKLQVGPNTLLWKAASLAALSLLFGIWRLWK